MLYSQSAQLAEQRQAQETSSGRPVHDQDARSEPRFGRRPMTASIHSVPSARHRPSIGGRIFRALTRFCIAVLIGVGATLGWQSYGDVAREMLAARAPELAWLLPVFWRRSRRSLPQLPLTRRCSLGPWRPIWRSCVAASNSSRPSRNRWPRTLRRCRPLMRISGRRCRRRLPRWLSPRLRSRSRNPRNQGHSHRACRHPRRLARRLHLDRSRSQERVSPDRAAWDRPPRRRPAACGR